MEPYNLFKDTLATMSAQQPQFYQQLTNMLGPEEQQVIKAAVEQADKIKQQQAAAATQGAADPQANGS